MAIKSIVLTTFAGVLCAISSISGVKANDSSLAVKNGITTKPLVVCLTADLYKGMLKNTLLGNDLEAAKYLQRGDCLEFKAGLHLEIIGHPEPAIAKVRIGEPGIGAEGYTMYYFVSED